MELIVAVTFYEVPSFINYWSYGFIFIHDVKILFQKPYFRWSAMVMNQKYFLISVHFYILTYSLTF